MSVVTYRIIKHDGAWAYEVNGTFSETFATREAARAAAKRAACEQTLPGASVPIDYEDEKGRWHHEFSSGGDRPKTRVDG
jgi:Uncharacterized protein conserved in bacteria (DUF2188)